MEEEGNKQKCIDRERMKRKNTIKKKNKNKDAQTTDKKGKKGKKYHRNARS
jgi:hypothetical protein